MIHYIHELHEQGMGTKEIEDLIREDEEEIEELSRQNELSKQRDRKSSNELNILEERFGKKGHIKWKERKMLKEILLMTLYSFIPAMLVFGVYVWRVKW